jgi:Tetratricopeptide repeat
MNDAQGGMNAPPKELAAPVTHGLPSWFGAGARWLWIPAILAGLLSAYPVLDNQFTNDDDILVVNNPYVHDFSHWKENLTRDYFYSRSSKPIGYYRPLVKLGFILQYQAFGARPFGYHLVSVLWFLMAVVLLYLLALQLRLPAVFAGLAATFLAVHPAQAECVGIVASQSDVMVLPSILLSVLAYLRWRDGRRQRWLAVSLVALTFGLGCKEIAVVVVGMVGVMELGRGDLKLRVLRKHWGWLLFLLPVVGYVALRWGLGVMPIQQSGEVQGAAWISAAGKLLDGALLRATVPLAWMPYLHADRPAATWAAALAWGLPAVAAMGGATWGVLRYRSFREALLLLLLPLLPLLLQSMIHVNLDPRRLVVSDRWVLLPGAGAGLLFAVLSHRAFGVTQRRLLQGAVLGLWAVLLLGMGLHARLENRSFRTEADRVIFETEALKSRGGLSPQERDRVAIGEAFKAARSGRLEESIRLYRQLLARLPGNYHLRFNLAAALHNAGRHREALFHAYVTFYGRHPSSGKTMPRNDSFYRHRAERAYLLGVIFEHLKRLEAARHHYRLSLRLNPKYTRARRRLRSLPASRPPPSPPSDAK